MTCRAEVLAAAKAVISRTKVRDFSIEDILAEMAKSRTTYAESTIRTHITSRLCRNAPSHHAVRYPDLVRVARGRYVLSEHGRGAASVSRR